MCSFPSCFARTLQGLTTAAATMDFPMIAAALAQMGATDQEVDIPAFAKDLKVNTVFI